MGLDEYIVKYTASGFSSSLEEAKAVILGIPLDVTTSFRPGTREAPRRIREMMQGLEEYSMALDADLSERSFWDAGDVCLPMGNAPKSVEIIKNVINIFLEKKKKIFSLGGEHLLSAGIIEAYSRYYPDLVVVQFDAHADLRYDYEGEKYSHATAMRRAAEAVGGKNLYQFGIRSAIKEELEYARSNTNLFSDLVVEPLKGVIEKIKDRPVYITLDIDCIDPSYAPGTGTAEPAGCSPHEIIKAVYMLGAVDVVGFDLVEVSPPLDVSDCTALLAAKILREALLTFI